MKLDSLFLQIFNMSVTASFVIVAVLFIRFLLKKAPKRFSYFLWFVSIFRLLSPITLEIPVGIITRTEVAADYELVEEPISFFGAAEAAYQLVGDVINGGIGLQHVRTTEHNPVTGNTVYITTDWTSVLILFGSFIWIGGIVCLVLYNALQFWKLRRKLVGAVPLRRNIFLVDYIESPFVIGILRPQIFLPSSLSEREQSFVILHEQHHIRRGDPVWKLLTFTALCLHWFNPLVWYAISLFDKDMEMSCDEAVMEKVSSDTRVEYSKTLLRFAIGKKALVGTPLAFGESDVKARVKNVIQYKKPALWGCVVAIILIVAAGGILITEPVSKESGIFAAEYGIDKLIYDVTKTKVSTNGLQEYLKTIYSPLTEFSISEFGMEQKGKNEKGEDVWTCFGDFEPYTISRDILESYLPNKDAWISSYNFTEITNAYILHKRGLNSEFEMKNNFHLLLQMDNGDVLFGMGWEEESKDSIAHTYMEYLALIESNFKKGQVDEKFFNRLLEHATGEQITTFEFYESDDIPGYLIVGFSSHSKDIPKHNETLTGPYGLLRPEHDMGFAVFQTNKNGTGYKLLDYYIYDNAINDGGSKIYYAEHPAVASADGIIKDDNAFDVVFCIDERVKSIVRVLDDGTEVIQTIEKGMVLLPWRDTKNSDRVKIYFLDENGDEVEYVPNKTIMIHDLSVNNELLSYHTANRYLKMWIDSDGDYKNDLLLQIALNESNTITPDSYMWLSW